MSFTTQQDTMSFTTLKDHETAICQFSDFTDCTLRVITTSHIDFQIDASQITNQTDGQSATLVIEVWSDEETEQVILSITKMKETGASATDTMRAYLSRSQLVHIEKEWFLLFNTTQAAHDYMNEICAPAYDTNYNQFHSEM